MTNKEFLEDFSLFRKLNAEIPSTTNRLPKVPINMEIIQSKESAKEFTESMKSLLDKKSKK